MKQLLKNLILKFKDDIPKDIKNQLDRMIITLSENNEYVQFYDISFNTTTNKLKKRDSSSTLVFFVYDAHAAPIELLFLSKENFLDTLQIYRADSKELNIPNWGKIKKIGIELRDPLEDSNINKKSQNTIKVIRKFIEFNTKDDNNL